MVLYAIRDWWLDLVQAAMVEIPNPDPNSRIGCLGTQFQARLFHRGVNVAVVNGAGGINAIQFVWLRANAEMELRHAAQEWWSWLGSPDSRGTPENDVELHIKFVYSLANTTGRLGRWPLFEIGTSIYDPLPERPTHDVALAGVGTLDTGEHRLSGWADGQLYYEMPNGTVHCLNDTPELLATVLKTCAEYYAP